MKKRSQLIIASLLGIALSVVIFMPKPAGEVETLDMVEVTDSVEVEEIVYKYGIPIDRYNVDYGVVKKNQTLSVILSSHGFSGRKIYEMVKGAKNIYDIRKIRGGQSYAFFMTPDTLKNVEFFVYEADARSYVVFDLRDTCKVTVENYPTEWRRREVRGKVESSLWNAMAGCNTNPILAIDLSRIFGWTIDFFGLQRNDEFRVIYNQEVIDGTEMANFRILAAQFTHLDSTYYAIPFVQDTLGELYYNEHGASLEGAFLKAPLDYFRITSRFSNSRYHPVLKRYRAHHGIDYAAPVGTPIYAIGAGTVIAKGFQAGGGGNFLKIKHNGTYVTSYMHLKGFAKGISVGRRVAQKEVIGYVGSTGLSTGPHLDFRVFENGKPINPLTVKSQPKAPVKPENLAAFNVLKDSVLKCLREMPIADTIYVEGVITDTLQMDLDSLPEMEESNENID